MAHLDDVHTAAMSALATLQRLSTDGGVLEQIASGQWDDRIAVSDRSGELAAMLGAMAERARLDRVLLDLLAPGRE